MSFSIIFPGHPKVDFFFFFKKLKACAWSCSTQVPSLHCTELVSPDHVFLLIGRRNINTAADFINTSMVF